MKRVALISVQNIEVIRGPRGTLFGANIAGEINVLGFIDFSIDTGFVDEPHAWGIEIGYEFGD